MSIEKTFIRIIIPLLERLLLLLSKLFEVAIDVLKTSDLFQCSLQGLEWAINDELGSTSWKESYGKARIIDAELDAYKDFKPSVPMRFFYPLCIGGQTRFPSFQAST